jgi:hypothetical protein
MTAINFIWFWQNHQIPAIGVDAPQRRIVRPGSADYRRYFDAKKRNL